MSWTAWRSASFHDARPSSRSGRWRNATTGPRPVNTRELPPYPDLPIQPQRVGEGLTFRLKPVRCGYCSHIDRPSFRRSYPSQSLLIGPGIEREHHMRAPGSTGVHIRSSSPRGMPGLRLEDTPPISMTFSTCGSLTEPRVHRTTSPFGRYWTPWIQQIPFLRSSGATRKRLKPAGNRIHAKRANLLPVDPRSRRPHVALATNSRTYIVLTRCIQWRMSSPPHIVTARRPVDSRQPHTNDVGTGHNADRAGYKPAMTSAAMTRPMCDAEPA